MDADWVKLETNDYETGQSDMRTANGKDVQRRNKKTMKSEKLKQLFEEEEKLKKKILSKIFLEKNSSRIEFTDLQKRSQKRLDILSSYVEEGEAPEPDELERLKQMDQKNEEDIKQILLMAHRSNLEKTLLDNRKRNETERKKEIDTVPTAAKRRRLTCIILSDEDEPIPQTIFPSSSATLLSGGPKENKIKQED
ncbi:hypothetical protein RF55_22587 [Lasius niger]|uniref:Uncharacterized protein n=1 Tax=Lasius niger TaxID=67767 RepID=A0A0J7JXA8_LASNI|nr:hypothetical protein RF55_22587 [Lasius niger]